MKVRFDRLKTAIDKLWYAQVGYGGEGTDAAKCDVEVEIIETDLEKSIMTMLQLSVKKKEGDADQTRVVHVFDESENRDAVMTSTEVKPLPPSTRK